MTIHAPFAKPRLPLLATAWRAITAAWRSSRICGHARSTGKPLRKDGEGQMPPLSTETLIHRRAMRSSNRRPDAAARFVRVHTILSRGR